jgi:hypothetical protein
MIIRFCLLMTIKNLFMLTLIGFTFLVQSMS